MAEEVPISNDEFAERLDAALQIEDDVARLAAMESAINDWNGGSMSNALLAKEVSGNQTLQATRDNDISRWALGTATEVITDPAGQPEPGYYPIRITRSGSIRWFPSIDKLQSEIAKGDKGDRGAEGASAGEIFVLSGGTADSDPGNGKIKFNADRTRVYVDNLNAGGTDVTAFLDALDDQPTAVRLQLTFRQLDSDKVGTLNITGATASATSYRTLTTVQVGDWPAFDTNARIALVPGFTPSMMTEVTSATALANDKAGYAQTEGDYAKAQGDYALAKGTAADTAAAGANLARDTASYKAVYTTRALLYADLAHVANDLGLVSDDPTPAYNGTYIKTGASGAGTWNKVDSVNGLILQPLSPDTGYLAAFADANGRATWLVRLDGTMEIRKVALPVGSIAGSSLSDGSVPTTKLDPSIQSALTRIAQAMNIAETGYAWVVVDAAGKIALGVKPDGSVVIPKFSPLASSAFQDGAVTTAKVADGAISLTKLASVLQPLIPLSMSVAETGYVFAIIGASNRMALAIKADGSVIIPKFVIPDGSVTTAKLASSVLTLLPQVLALETGYAWALVDAAGKIGLGVKIDGTVVGKIPNTLSDGGVTTAKIAAGAVTEAKLDPPLARLAVPHIGDVVEVTSDNWRSKYGSVTTRTEANGSLWATFPRFLTKTLRGINLSGSVLEFRRTSGLAIRGRRKGTGYDWNPVAVAAVASTTLKGNTTDPSSLSTSGRVAGDYYRYSPLTTTTFNSQTVGLGDLIVFDGSAFQVQKAPTPVGNAAPTTRERGDWWAVTADGTFDGVTYTAGDRIVCVGFDSQSGFGNNLWYKGKASTDGELFYNGEHDASGGTYPASPAQGDLYQISVAGTLGGVAYSVGDWLLYDTAVWGRIPGNPITTVAAGGMIPGLTCNVSASEWEVRRADKNNARVGVTAGARHQTSPRRSVDGIVCRSDSMFGVSQMQSNLSALVTPRTVVAIARGGGTSDNVLSTKEYEVAVGGDPYRGWLEFIWQGQNNQPAAVGDGNWCRTIECAIRIDELLGARDNRGAFLSILGSMGMTFNGSRCVVTQWEGMFAGTHVLAALEQWYIANFPGKYITTRTALLAKAISGSYASSLPDPRVLGAQTEAQTAAAYGWIPYSWMNRTNNYSFSLASLNYIDWWNTSGAIPSSGGADGDAYVRSGGTSSNGSGGIGNLIVKQAGVWAEYAPDVIHIGGGVGQGGPPLAAVLNDYLVNNKL